MKPHIWYDRERLFWVCSEHSSYHAYFEYGKGETPLEAYNAWVYRGVLFNDFSNKLFEIQPSRRY